MCGEFHSIIFSTPWFIKKKKSAIMVSCSPRRSSVMLDPHQTSCLEHLVMWPIITYLPNPKMRLYYLEAFLFSCDVWLNYKSKKREIYLFSYLLHVYIYFFSPTNDWINVLLISSTTFTVQFYCVKKKYIWSFGKNYISMVFLLLAKCLHSPNTFCNCPSEVCYSMSECLR